MTQDWDEEPEAVLAVDYGERRVGLAISDPRTGFVRGLPTIDRRRARGSLARAVARIAAENSAERILLGIPYEMDGAEGAQAEEVRAFQARLTMETALPITEWDERLSTEAARRRLREAGLTERRMRAQLDKVAAVLMLESFLRRAGGSTDTGWPA